MIAFFRCLVRNDVGPFCKEDFDKSLGLLFGLRRVGLSGESYR